MITFSSVAHCAPAVAGRVVGKPSLIR